MAKPKKDEIDFTRSQIKSYAMFSGLTLKEVTKRLTEKYGIKETIDNLSGKLSRGSVRYIEVLRIADVLGYEIQWVKKDKK